MKTSISNKLIIGFTLATAFLLFFAIITFINMQKVKSDSKKQFESFIILKNIEDLYVSVLEIESDSRGYAITGKKSFLDNYENAIKQINIKLRELISENNNQRIKNSELLKIKQHIAEKLEFCNKIISLRDDYGLEESLALVRTEKGKILISKIRTAIRSIEENERLYLYESNNLQIKSADFTVLIFTILLLIITVILSLVYYYFNTDQSEKKYSELALKEAKDQLQAILDNNNSLVFIKNLEGKFIFVNKPFERKVKLTSQFILGSTDYDFYPKEDADKFYFTLKRLIYKNKLAF